MGQMLIDLLFSNSDGLGEFPGAHLPLAQELNHLLTDGLHLISFLFLLEKSRKQQEHNIFKGLISPNGEDNPFNWHGAPGTTRTCGLRIRSPLLYPAELQAHFISCSESGTRGRSNTIPLGSFCPYGITPYNLLIFR